MPISLAELVERLSPTDTTLILGAGASIPSGAPSGSQLAERLWNSLTHQSPLSDDLIETASILSRKFGRKAVIEVVVSALAPLKPQGGLLALPTFGWKSVYTTNFDLLYENAAKAAQIKCYSIRSNFDYTAREANTGVGIFKVHGCITQDSTMGHKASMIITEGDYEEFNNYRQVLFAAMRSSLLQGDALVIGQSLADRHLHDLVKDVLASKQQGAPGHLYVLAYTEDDLRAPLLEDRGAKIAFGGIDEFIHSLALGAAPAQPPKAASTTGILQLLLIPTVIDVDAEKALPSNVVRMFNGGAANYSDIEVGGTFERARTTELEERLFTGDRPTLALIGAGGVGKTTFARQLLSRLAKRGFNCWEHRSDFPLNYREWAAVEARLRLAGNVGVLLIDECTRFLRQVNQLVEHLSELPQSALRVVLTANSAQWAPRMKSPILFSRGIVLELSRLENDEIHSLINLLEFNREISALVYQEFKMRSRAQQFQILRQKCSADMYVCLKNIFANESLDVILLREYDDLPETSREYYRYVAALQAVGTHVHRQLIIRMLGIQADKVNYVLEGLKGIVDEYDIVGRDGIYGWTTRHLVIARKITEYKFSGIEELTALFERIIDNVNPTVKVELQSVRDICDTEYGIGRLGDTLERQKLYRRLIAVTPGERIPWHRLIREILSNGSPEEAEQVIKNAEAAVGADAPLDRYKVRLLTMRASKTAGISETDRLALVRKAYEQAMVNVGRHRWDKFSYYTLCQVALDAVRRGESEYLFKEALSTLKEASERILDPEMDRRARQFEDEAAHIR